MHGLPVQKAKLKTNEHQSVTETMSDGAVRKGGSETILKRNRAERNLGGRVLFGQMRWDLGKGQAFEGAHVWGTACAKEYEWLLRRATCRRERGGGEGTLGGRPGSD